ncbi:MAG TPA: YrdB family protein [Gaiellaceae bacterium]|jgi:hypothetical protein|nr:YrdB family protein [Gaiellaceae bacterium]
MSATERLNLVLRVLMETGVVAGLAYWGVHTGDSTAGKIGLGIGAPVLGFGFWGGVDFHQAGPVAEPARLVQELVVSGLAAAAWYTAGQPILGIALAALSLLYHVSVYASGQRLLEPQGSGRESGEASLGRVGR